LGRSHIFGDDALSLRHGTLYSGAAQVAQRARLFGETENRVSVHQIA
jgi:hypothetical protein